MAGDRTVRARVAHRSGTPRVREGLARQRTIKNCELLDELIHDLDSLEEAEATEWLSYAEAARVSGYSAKQLTRLADTARVDFRGENRNRRFRRGSLPIKRRPGPSDGASTPRSAAPLGQSASKAPARAPNAGSHPPESRPSRVAARRGRPYDAHADAQRFARKADTMEDSP